MELCETYIQVGWQFGVRVLATCKSYESIVASPSLGNGSLSTK